MVPCTSKGKYIRNIDWQQSWQQWCHQSVTAPFRSSLCSVIDSREEWKIVEKSVCSVVHECDPLQFLCLSQKTQNSVFCACPRTQKTQNTENTEHRKHRTQKTQNTEKPEFCVLPQITEFWVFWILWFYYETDNNYWRGQLRAYIAELQATSWHLFGNIQISTVENVPSLQTDNL